MIQERYYPHGDPDWPHSFSIDYARLYAEYFDDFPDLEEALRDHSGGLLITRFMMAPFALIESPFLYEIWDRTRESGQFMAVRHPPELSVDGNIYAIQQQQTAIMERLGTDMPPRVLKTVTIAFPLPDDEGRYIVLYSGIGDFRISKQTKRDISQALGLTNYSAKRAIINPSVEIFDPMFDLGIIPGQVKPIISKERLRGIHAICYAHQDPADAATHVAVTDSPFDSFIVPVSIFEDTLRWYAQKYYKAMTPVKLPEMDIYCVDKKEME